MGELIEALGRDDPKIKLGDFIWSWIAEVE
jgi:hypothetical protein